MFISMELARGGNLFFLFFLLIKNYLSYLFINLGELFEYVA